KTVFLTSLIDHLRKHNSERFPLRNKRRALYTLEHTELPPRHEVTPAFPATSFRQSLQKNQWPGKTTDKSEYRCKLVRSDRWLYYLDLSLTDFAGERLADMSMAGYAYNEWSDTMLKFFARSEAYTEAMRPYLDVLARLDPSAREAQKTLLKAYRLG